MTYTPERNRKLIEGLALSRTGIEYGPMTRPAVTREMGPVLYVDYADTETIKAKHHRHDNPDDIMDIDLVWGDGHLKDHGPFAYAVASHVIEHIPDPIGWLRELANALTDDGIIALAVPDKRYTFDLNRPISTTGEFIQAWLEKRKRPSIRQVFDNCRLAVEVTAADVWAGKAQAPPLMMGHALQLAYDQCVEQVSDELYIDSHCWIFTPASFLDLCEDFFQLGVLPLEIEHFIPTERNDLEFIVRLRRAGIDPIATVDAARQALRQWEAGLAMPEEPHRPLPWRRKIARLIAGKSYRDARDAELPRR